MPYLLDTRNQEILSTHLPTGHRLALMKNKAQKWLVLVAAVDVCDAAGKVDAMGTDVYDILFCI